MRMFLLFLCKIKVVSTEIYLTCDKIKRLGILIEMLFKSSAKKLQKHCELTPKEAITSKENIKDYDITSKEAIKKIRLRIMT